MEDLQNTISQILGDPDSMAQIMSLAQSLGGTLSQEPAERQETPASLFPDFPIQTVMDLMKQADSGDQREIQLLNALKSCCSEERQLRIERALRVAKISRLAGAALRTFSQKE